jgi:hypothetical protein
VTPTRRLLLTGSLLVLVFVPAGAAIAANKDAPIARTGAATEVTATTARVNAQLTAGTEDATYWFEYGPTTAYGSATPSGLLKKKLIQGVSAVLEDLTPGTTYHVTLRAKSTKGPADANDQVFTTSAAATRPTAGSTAPGTPTPASDTPDPGTSDGAAGQPVLGDAVVVAPAKGIVRVKAAGASGYVELHAGDAIPVGSIVDTRRGTVALTTSVAGGGTQTGEFRGAIFQVRQSPRGKGMTDIVLRGGPMTGCGRTAQAARRTKRTVRRLWAKDDGGRFRTHGRNSVATVRGTSWVTTETCAGTRTTVTHGAVSVRDLRRKRSVLVRAGHSYLARAKR